MSDDRFDPDDFEDELPDEDQLDETSETVPCPECGAEIYEDAERCPVCGQYVIHRRDVWAGRPLWWIVLGLLGVVAVVVILAVT